MSRPRPLIASVTLAGMVAARLGRAWPSDLLAVLHVVAERSDDHGCHTGAETLGRDLGWTARRVRRWLGKARQQGLIDVTVRKGRGRPSVIRFLSPIHDAPDLADIARFDADARKQGQAHVPVSDPKQGQAAVPVRVAETGPSDIEKGTPDAGNRAIGDPKQGQAAVPHTSFTSCTPENTSALASLARSLDVPDTDDGDGNGARKERPAELTRLEGIRLALNPAVRPRQPMTEEEWAERQAHLRQQAQALGVAR